MKTSPAGLALIESFEKCKFQVYNDAAGKPTIGWGHLILPGENFSAGVTQQQADDILAKDLGKAEAIVNRAVIVPLRQNQFDALVSFSFNEGMRPTVFALVNAGNEIGVVDKFLEYRIADGRPFKGLVRRRCAEAALFLS